MTKAERRAKLKKSKREAKKQGKEMDKTEEEQAPQAAVLVYYDLQKFSALELILLEYFPFGFICISTMKQLFFFGRLR